MDDTEHLNRESDFQETLKDARQDETVIWNKVQQVSSHSHVALCLLNGTARTFELTAASWDIGAAPEEYLLHPWSYLTFVLRAQIPVFARGRVSTQATHRFTYKSGDQSFEFSTWLKVRKKYQAFSFAPDTVAQREHSVRSTGKAQLLCFSAITQAMANRPYHYAVAVSLGGQY
ncbi:hypothetical protein [Pseudomonas orientalis]|uniref:hypothetical protein n=1 Tax=Pseudomonas orientalis TaxID=76758 RepID=UPI00130003FD|nr:hypothetical protein [Pseudomonas orientalis]